MIVGQSIHESLCGIPGQAMQQDKYSAVYSAFGQLVETTGANYCRFKFSSKELNASWGFYYYGYRFYAPQWQR